MRCERCHADTRVERHAVDGFTGHLCADCRDTWERLTTSG